MYSYYNPNPKNNSANDCVVRMLCKLLDVDWDTAYDILYEEGRRVKEIPTTNYVWEGLLEDMGMKRFFMQCATNCPTFKQFIEKNQNGVYVLCSGSHVATAIDGCIYDAWDSSSMKLQYFYAYGR